MDDAKPTTPPKRRSKKQKVKAAAVKAQREAKRIALRGIEKAQDAFSRQPPSVQQGVQALTFAGLTYGYKTGAIDILGKVGFTGVSQVKANSRVFNEILLGGAAYGGTPVGAVGGMLGHLAAVGVLSLLTGVKDDGTGDKPEDAIVAGREKLAKARVDIERAKADGHYRDHMEKYYEDKTRLMQAEIQFNLLAAKYELGKWLVAMGLAGATIYLLQEYSVSELVEAVPLI